MNQNPILATLFESSRLTLILSFVCIFPSFDLLSNNAHIIQVCLIVYISYLRKKARLILTKLFQQVKPRMINEIRHVVFLLGPAVIHRNKLTKL